MTNPNIPLVYEVLVAYQQRDEEKLRERMDPEIEIYGAPDIVNAGTYEGFEGYRRWVREWEEAWDEVAYELGEIIEVDESVLVAPVHVVGIGALSGVQIDSVFGWLYVWKDGLATRFHVYASVDDALEAARDLAAERT
jgi:ketosteroid isomerase-like protein